MKIKYLKSRNLAEAMLVGCNGLCVIYTFTISDYSCFIMQTWILYWTVILDYYPCQTW